MDKVEAFLRKQQKIIQADRDKTLIELGLSEKEYNPSHEYSTKYPESEVINGTTVYYRNVPIKVTDEQWKAIQYSIKKVEECKTINLSNAVYSKAIIPFQLKKHRIIDLDLENKLDSGISKLASAVRIMAWVLGVFEVIAGFSFIGYIGIFALIIGLLSAAINIILLLPIAAILEYLASITSILRGGYKLSDYNN